MSGLPARPLAELADLKLGKMLDKKRATGQHPRQYLRNINVRWHAIQTADLAEMDIPPEQHDRYSVLAGDVLICEGGEPGRAAVVPAALEGLAFQKALHRARCGPDLLAEYLCLTLHGLALSGSLSVHFTGTTIRHLPSERLRDVLITLPDLAAQKSAISALGEHLETQQQAQAALLALGRRFTSVLSAQRLHSFDDNKTVPLRQLVQRVEAGRSFACVPRPATPQEWGVIKVSSMTWGEFREQENKAIPPERSIEAQYEVKPGDILVSRANTEQYVGAPVLVPASCRSRLLLSDKSLRLVPAPGVQARWLFQVLASPQVRAQISAAATGTKDSMRNISQRGLLDVRVPEAPTPAVQYSLAAALEDTERHLDRLRQEAKSVDDKIGKLFVSAWQQHVRSDL